MTEKQTIDEVSERDRGEFDWNKFGRIVKHYRTQNSIKLEQLQDLTGCPITVISNAEKGRPMSVENLMALCVFLNFNPCRLHSRYVKPGEKTQVVTQPVSAEPKPAANPLSLFVPDN